MSAQSWQHFYWLIAGFVGCALGYGIGVASREKSPLRTVDSTPPLSEDDAAGQPALRLEALTQQVDNSAFSYPLYQELLDLDEQAISNLLSELRATLPEGRERFDHRISTVIHRLAEISPDTAIAFCESINTNDARHRFFYITGGAIGATDHKRAITLAPVAGEDRLAYLNGVVENVPQDGVERILFLLDGAPKRLRERLLDRFDGPSDQLVALSDTHAASARISGIEDPIERRNALNKLLENVARVNLSAAIALANDFPEMEHTINSYAAVGPFLLRPRETIRLILTLPPGENRDHLLSNCLRAAARIDPAIAHEVAGSIGGSEVKADAIRDFALELSRKNPDAALEFAKQHGPTEELERIIQYRKLHRLANDDPAKALASIAHLPPGESRDELVRSAVSKLTGWVPSESLTIGREETLLEQILPIASDATADSIEIFLNQWVDRDSAEALRAVSENGQLVSVRADVWSYAAESDPLPTIHNALETGDTIAAKAAVTAGIQSLASNQPAAAVEVLLALLDDPQHAKLIDDDDVGTVSRSLARDQPIQEVWDWALSLPAQLGEDAALAAASERVMYDFDEVSKMLRSPPPGQLRDRGMSNLAMAASEADPARAFSILQQLPKSAYDAWRTRRVLKNWVEIDATAARAAADAAGIALNNL